jgi:Uma2 family endonuclease
MALPVWATDPSSLILTEDQYDALPEDVCRTIEVVYGHVVFLQAPTREHSRIGRRLAAEVERIRPESPCIEVDTEIDVRYSFTANLSTTAGKVFTFRRPDVVVYDCLSRGDKVYTEHVRMMVEIANADSYERDGVDKRAEYAYQRVPLYLVVIVNDSGRIRAVEEYRLDWSGRNYGLAATHYDALDVEIIPGTRLRATFAELES